MKKQASNTKLKVLILGGEAKNIKKELDQFIEYEHIPKDKEVHKRVMPEAQAIVTLTRFLSRDSFKRAKDLCRSRGIPLVPAETGNYILPELRRHKLLPEEVHEEEHPEPPAESTKDTVATTVTESGLTLDQLVAYLPKFCEAIKELLTPGEKIHEDDLLDAMDGMVGPPREDLKHLLPYVASKGILINTVGKTWKCVGPDYIYEEDKEEVPRAERQRGTIMKTLAALIRGLPEGPYPNRYSIVREVERFEEFRKPDGTKYSRHYLEIIAQKAEELGYITEVDGQKLVDHSDEVKLTLSPEEEEKPKASKTHKKDKVTSAKVSTHAPPAPAKVSEPEEQPEHIEMPPEPAKPIDALSMAMLKSKLGFIESPKLMGTLNRVRQLLPQAYWDDLAQNSIAKRLRKANIEPVKMSSETFTREEWYTLVWETLSALPMSVVAPAFLEDLKFEDIKTACRECGRDFIFTVNEQQFFQRQFGEVITPSKCSFCRKMKRAAEGRR